MMKRPIALLLFAGMLAVWPAMAADTGPRQPSQEDKCPVCGMFVYKYPDWTAEIIFDDGAVYFFDGAKDLFKFYFDLERYVPGRTAEHIAAIYVTEFYDMTLVDARSAFYVIGSDVYGPMGRELIPFRTEADAGEFLKDHKGTQILVFDRIRPAEIKRLD